MRILFSTLIISFMIFSGCDIFSSSSEKNFSSFTIETNQEIYSSNEKVEVLFINKTNHAVFFSPCASSLQRFENNSWSNISVVMCTAAIPRMPIEIKSGKEFSYNSIWFGNEYYEEGEYRIVFFITDKDGEKLPFDRRVTSKITVTN